MAETRCYAILCYSRLETSPGRFSRIKTITRQMTPENSSLAGSGDENMVISGLSQETACFLSSFHNLLDLVSRVW